LGFFSKRHSWLQIPITLGKKSAEKPDKKRKIRKRAADYLAKIGETAI